MLEVVQFENGKYGLRNVLTGIVLPEEYRTKYFVLRARRKKTDRLLRAMRRISPRGNRNG